MPIVTCTVQRAIAPAVLLPALVIFTFYYVNTIIDYNDFDSGASTTQQSQHVINYSSTYYNDYDDPTVYIPPNYVAENERKIIVMGSQFFGGPFDFKDMPQPCRVSHDITDLPLADAVVFHALDAALFGVNIRDDNQPRVNVDQVYIGVMYESAKIYPNIAGAFNWTMTFRRDSDVYSPYCGRFRTATKGQAIADLQPRLENLRNFRRLMVAWMVSNCQDHNLRLSYALELSKYIQVDIYGSCSPNGLQCSRFTQSSNGTENPCWDMLASNYKFYLSFESSNCKDYVTEKFYMPMYYGILPIVYGGSSVDDYKNLAPPHSYIDTRSFASPRQLADFLLKLDQSPEEYEEYFAWRKHFTLDYNRAFVGQDLLCGKLWNLKKYRKPGSSQKFGEWWRDGSCVAPHYKPAPTWLTLLLELTAVGICISFFGYLIRAYLRKVCLEKR